MGPGGRKEAQERASRHALTSLSTPEVPEMRLITHAAEALAACRWGAARLREVPHAVPSHLWEDVLVIQ